MLRPPSFGASLERVRPVAKHRLQRASLPRIGFLIEAATIWAANAKPVAGSQPASVHIRLASELSCLVNGHGRSLRGQACERSDKVARSLNLEMLCQSRLVGPFLDKNETIWIFGIYVHGMRNAAGLGPRTSNVRLAQSERFPNSAALRNDTSDDEDHSDASLLFD
jgi:hypothetical protein